MDISQYGNIYDASQLLIEGGEQGTYYCVVHVADQLVKYTDFPSVKKGVELHYDDTDYWKYKTPRVRQAIQLTVTGNAVCCESALREMGYDAHAIQPTVVMVVIPYSQPMNEIN